MPFTVVIPARYASSRLPGKPLLDIAGKSMLQRVYDQAAKSEAERIIIATDDERIKQVAESFGAEVCMTSPEHSSGTDRLQEVASQCGFYSDDIIVNVQGDEPLIPPRLINQVAHNLAADPAAGISTLCERISDVSAVHNPNVVKVVTDHQGYALYFSRATIAWARDAFADQSDQLPPSPLFRHIGLYGYRVKMLNDFVRWSPAPIEQAEQLEQLRALWNGVRIHVAEADEDHPAGVDTPEDLERVRALVSEAP
ncbi:3-deoxy-manno-octulosonate cytidylyltransferase [Oceanospirillum sediminis]|nr:3-deoxy-manno-octulosonate cytidylyltransferase [Oceanospirillum sediminis]